MNGFFFNLCAYKKEKKKGEQKTKTDIDNDRGNVRHGPSGRAGAQEMTRTMDEIMTLRQRDIEKF